VSNKYAPCSINTFLNLLYGTSKLYNRPCYEYRHDKDGNLEVVWQQALVVQKIFDYYLEGSSILQIIKLL